MPDRRRHRSAAPRDRELFGPNWLPRLQEAAGDLEWLLDRGYPEGASLKLVGDRYRLRTRQREALRRAVSAPARARERRLREVPAAALAGRILDVDGYNLLTTLESALGGGVLVAGNDGCLRDLASVGGTWRRVEETLPALELCGRWLRKRGLRRVRWWLDQPVSNSGMLRGLLQGLARERHWPWSVHLIPDPDPELARSRAVVATADRQILDACGRWTNLGAALARDCVAGAWIVDLGAP